MSESTVEPGQSAAPEKGGEMETDNVQSFSEDADISELLGYLKKIGDVNGYKDVFDAVSYVNTLESTINGMAKQITDMREEIQTVHEQNAYLMSRAERTAKDILVDQLSKAENHVKELGKRLSDMKDALKQSAREMLDRIKVQKDKAVLRFADFIHVKNALSRLRDKADDVVNRLDNLSDRVDAYKQQSEKERERRPESERTAGAESFMPAAVVAEERTYHDSEPPLSYEQEMEKFMANRVSEGVTYSCNQDAYEDFKVYYDKKMKADSMAGAKPVIPEVVADKSR